MLQIGTRDPGIPRSDSGSGEGEEGRQGEKNMKCQRQ